MDWWQSGDEPSPRTPASFAAGSLSLAALDCFVQRLASLAAWAGFGCGLASLAALVGCDQFANGPRGDRGALVVASPLGLDR